MNPNNPQFPIPNPAGGGLPGSDQPPTPVPKPQSAYSPNAGPYQAMPPQPAAPVQPAAQPVQPQPQYVPPAAPANVPVGTSVYPAAASPAMPTSGVPVTSSPAPATIPGQPQAYVSPALAPELPPKNKFKMPVIIGSAVIVVLALGIASYFMLTGGNKTVSYSETVTTSNSSSDGTSSSTAVVNFTANCGKKDCFDQKFASCASAETTATDADIGGTAKFTINGPKGSGCSVTMIFTGMPIASWNNKSMTCNFNDKVNIFDAEGQVVNDLVTSKANPDDCSGPLMSVIQSTYAT